jgi:hypothetical protein
MEPRRPDEHDELFAFEADAPRDVTGSASADAATVPADPSTTTVRAFSLQPRPSLMRWLAEHNPFYLLSAACMLAGCLALTNSLSWVSITPHRLLTLIATLNLYEALVLAIALFLITKRGLRRDGRMLLLLQAFFLADFTFLNAEIATANVRTGLAVNAILLLLAAIKLGIVLRVLRPNFTATQYGFVLLQLAVLFVTPLALRWLDANRGIVNPKQFYGLWWVIGLLPAVYELLTRIDPRGRVMSVSPNAQAAPITAYLALPYISLLAHVGVLHWVYIVDFFGAHAGPILLGLTLVLDRFSPNKLVPRKDLLTLRLLLPAAAVLVSMNNPFTFGPAWAYPRFELTTFNLAVAGAFLVYLYCFLLPYARIVLVAGAMAALWYAFGPTIGQVANGAQRGWDYGVDVTDKLAPKTLADWGVIGLVASFTFLAIGFWISLRKQPDVPEFKQAPDA